MHGPEQINYALPNSDENAPDLYLPLMSLITYCLLCALCYGTAGQFNPEVIASVTSWCFGTQIVEVGLIRLGLYTMDTPIPILDLFAYTGYKYLGLTINMLFGLLFGLFENWGRTGFYITFLWTATASTVFMLKTMSNTVPTQTASTGPGRNVMVLGFALSQAVTMWFVSQTKFL
jgi:protein transport protein YIF1